MPAPIHALIIPPPPITAAVLILRGPPGVPGDPGEPGNPGSDATVTLAALATALGVDSISFTADFQLQVVKNGVPSIVQFSAP